MDFQTRTIPGSGVGTTRRCQGNFPATANPANTTPASASSITPNATGLKDFFAAYHRIAYSFEFLKTFVKLLAVGF